MKDNVAKSQIAKIKSMLADERINPIYEQWRAMPHGSEMEIRKKNEVFDQYAKLRDEFMKQPSPTVTTAAEEYPVQ